MMTQNAILRNWNIYRSLYGSVHASGNVYDDVTKRFDDGDKIHTSAIQEINLEENYIITRNTKYILD